MPDDRLCALLCYNGSSYAGWQIQPNAVTIQEVVENLLSDFFHENIKVTASGRTDAGVHSDGQVIAFNIRKFKTPIDKLTHILNRKLPEDIYFKSFHRVKREFHPRYDACARLYRYRFAPSENYSKVPAEIRPFTAEIPGYPDPDKIRQLLEPLTGTHDFSALASLNDPSPVKTREIFYISLQKKNFFFEIDICANAFLRSMVRSVVGNMFFAIKSGQSKEYLKTLLDNKDPLAAHYRAPAKGLTLRKVYYTPLFGKRRFYKSNPSEEEKQNKKFL